MVNPTLTKSGVTFNTSGGTTLTLYNASSESGAKDANLIPLPLPLQDSDQTILMDLLGVTRTFTVNGKYTTGDDGGNVYLFARDLDLLINGNQGGGSQAGWTYTSVVLNLEADGTLVTSPVTKRVYVERVSYDTEAGNPNILSYSISLIEANSSTSQ